MRHHVMVDLLQQSTYHFPLLLEDHIGGFDADLKNVLLEKANTQAREQNQIGQVVLDFPVDDRIKSLYPNLEISHQHCDLIWSPFESYRIHPEVSFSNFICSFNRSGHVSRQLLLSALGRRGWFDSGYSSKNFVFDIESVQGHIKELVGDRDRLYNRLFTTESDKDFYSNIFEIGDIESVGGATHGHKGNMLQLETQLTQSFVHVVAETLGTSYYPFITEKFLYSVVTRGLFVAYAQPQWHHYLEKFYGFVSYRRIFDFEFDKILCPVARLDSLMCMLSKFENLSTHDWHDLYLLESDSIEYNYDHYFSRNYLKCLANFA